MSEPKFLQLTETNEQETTRKATAIVTSVVRACESAIGRVKTLAADRGGKTAFLAELGDKATDFVAVCADIKALAEKLSDLTVDTTIPEAPE